MENNIIRIISTIMPELQNKALNSCFILSLVRLMQGCDWTREAQTHDVTASTGSPVIDRLLGPDRAEIRSLSDSTADL